MTLATSEIRIRRLGTSTRQRVVLSLSTTSRTELSRSAATISLTAWGVAMRPALSCGRRRERLNQVAEAVEEAQREVLAAATPLVTTTT